MSEEWLADEIRDAFESGHVPSPGLESRVIASIPWGESPKRRSSRRMRLAVAVAAVLVVGAVAGMATSYSVAANATSQTEEISQSQAIADAMNQLPNDGAGYVVVATQLEASSKHFEFTGPNGQGFGEDEVQECLVIPPLPRIPIFTPCRYYPVWVVDLSAQNCDVVVGINAYTGRFAGGGAGSHGDSAESSLDQCQFVPQRVPDMPWFQPTWG